jgi:rubrerythrin
MSRRCVVRRFVGNTDTTVRHARRNIDEKERGETEPILWVCTVCHNPMEGELPEKCPECGADKSEFEEAPKPRF